MTDWGCVLISGLDYRGMLPLQGNIQDWLSEPAKADGLVHRANGNHTLQIHTINLSAVITIEGTLDLDPENGLWLTVPLVNSVTNNTVLSLPFVFVMPVPGVPYSGKTTETNQFFFVQGQYAWLRCRVSNISTGQVDLVKLAY